MPDTCSNIPKCWVHAIGILAAALIAAIAISQIIDIVHKIRYGGVPTDVEMRNTIVVSGTGEVVAKNDIAGIQLSVRSEALTAESVSQKNNTLANNVMSSIKSFGIEDKDISTSAYNLYPKYSYERETGISEIIGYELTQTISVKIRELDIVGDVIASAAEAGANQIGGISFTVDDDEALKAQARDKAIEHAKEKAKEIAQSAGFGLGRIVGFSENGAYVPKVTRVYAEDMALGLGGADSVPTPSIEAGSETVSASVTLEFEIF